MSQEFTLNAVVRADNQQGKGASRRLRKENLIPAIIYGKGEAKAIAVRNNELIKALESDEFYSATTTLVLEGGNEQVVIQALQRHPSKGVPLHVDFKRV